MLLENPTALIQMTLEDVEIKVVDVLADIKRCSTWSISQSDVVPLSSRLQESTPLTICLTSRQNAICRTEDSFHILCLHVKVTIRPLDDADRVYP